MKVGVIDEIIGLDLNFQTKNHIFEPIKQMSTLVYENILSDIKDEQDQLEQTEYSRKSLLHDKTFKAIDCFAKIINIDNPNENTEFKNELAILNK